MQVYRKKHQTSEILCPTAPDLNVNYSDRFEYDPLTFLEAFPQHPGVLPIGSHPSARTTSVIMDVFSNEEHPGSTDTLRGLSIFGSFPMFLWRNGMICSALMSDA